MICTSQLVQQGSGINDFFENCCGLAEFILTLSPLESNHTITKIEWIENGALDCGSVPISYNGATWADPLPVNFTLTQNNQLSVIVSICECNGTSITGELKIHTQGGATHSFYYDFNKIKIDYTSATNVQWFPCSNDCTQIQPIGIDVYNNTGLTYTITIDSDCDDIFGGTIDFYLNGVASGLTNQVQIPAMSTGVIQWTMCGSTLTTGICEMILDVCGDINIVEITIQPVVCNDCGLNCIGARLETENNYIPINFDFCELSAGELYTYAAIGEKKKLVMEYQYNNGFFTSGAYVYFNPVLFDVVCNFANLYGTPTIDSPPPSGFIHQFQLSDIGAGGIPMTLFGAGANANAQKNFTATIYFYSAYTFNIIFDFYLIEDIENWIDSSSLANQTKLLNNHVSAPVPLVNNVQSVYNVDKNLCVLSYISDPNTLVAVPGTNPTQYENFECHSVKSMPITARFYNKGLYNGTSEMTNPQFTLFRNLTQVNNLSSIVKTQVKFKIDYPGVLTNVLFWVIDASQIDDSVTFLQNYDSSRGEITTIGGTGVIDNNLFSPSVAPTLISPGVYECSAYVGINLNPSGQYYIIAVCYDSNAYIVNSFISSEFGVTQIPGNDICCPMDVTTFWFDYHNKIADPCFCPTMKERLKNTLNVNSGDFGNCVKDYGWNPALVDWTTFLTDIKLNIYRKIVDFPIVGQTTYFMYDQLQSLRIPGYPNNFNNLSSNLICAESGLAFDVEWNGRVRYENNALPGSQVFFSNNATPMNRIPAGALGNTYVSTNGITYNWADQDIYFEYIFRFDLSSLFPTTFITNLVYINKIHPIDFETNPAPYASLFKPLLIEGVKGTNPPVQITGQFCEGQYDYLIVTMSDNVSPDLVGEFIAFIDKYPYGIQNLEESDPIASPSGMIQLSSIPIYNVSNVFNGSAQFYIDLSVLPVGKYQLCGLYHK